MTENWRFKGLTVKLLLALVGATVLITVGQGLFSAIHIRRGLERSTYRSADRIADVVRRSTRASMLRNHREQVQELMDNIAAGPASGSGIVRMRIFNKDGRIIFSTDKTEIGRRVDNQTDPTCKVCHAQEVPLTRLSAPERMRIFREPDGSRTLGVIVPVENEVACSAADCHVHDPGQRVLGMLDVNASLKEADKAMAASLNQMFVGLLVSGAIAAAVAFLFVLIMVQRPVSKLMEGTRRVASGDMDHVIRVTSRDEMGVLAAAFNDMTQRLKEAMQVVRHWNETLQNQVDEKTQELERAQEHLLREERIVGKSPAIKKVMDLVKVVAPTDATVLIRGESGTGKELVAKAIHLSSPRRYMPLVTVNCGILPESLLESELFGHERGASTEAQYLRKGKFEMADGGTILLAEIGDVSPKIQTDLLRVLEEKQICRVGGSRMIPVDFRVVAATHRDLQAMVGGGEFREDLFYRLNVFQVTLPPLRERVEDIPLLVQDVIEKVSRQMGKVVTGVSSEAMTLLKRRPWPGNIRELQIVVERAVVLAQSEELTREDLTFGDEGAAPPAAGGEAALSLSDLEKIHVERVLKENGWNISLSARILGIDRATLYNKVKRYGLVAPGT